jgi:hypothetical protein
VIGQGEAEDARAEGPTWERLWLQRPLPFFSLLELTIVDFDLVGTRKRRREMKREMKRKSTGRLVLFPTDEMLHRASDVHETLTFITRHFSRSTNHSAYFRMGSAK